MRINSECARKVLIEVEKIEYGESISVSELQKTLGYPMNEVLNVIFQFSSEDYINMLDRRSYDNGPIYDSSRITSLTRKGYYVLDDIRSDKTWNMVKEKLSNFDEISFFTLVNIIGKINDYNYNKIFDIPNDFVGTWK